MTDMPPAIIRALDDLDRFKNGRPRRDDNAEANARLIAAAPDLLDQLIKAHDAFDAICMGGHVHLVSAAMPDGFGMDTIRAAIAKARGQ